MLRPDTLALTVLLALLTALGPVAMDLYLPSLPDIGRLLAAPPSQVQLTISGYLIGFASGQIVYGPVSDRFGRKPVLCFALVLFCVATLICAAAPTIEALIAARALQGVGASGVIVLARAVVRDLYEGRRAGRELSLMGMIMGIAPMIGPVVGSLLQIAFGWRAGFFLTFAIGLALIVVVWRLLPETAPARKPGALGLADFVGAFGAIAKNRSFRSHLAIMSASYAGLFAFISGAPFVMQDVYGLTPLGFGIFFAITAVGFVVGTFLASRLVIRTGLHRTIGYGAFTLAAGGVALIASAVLLPGSVVAVGLSIMIFLAGLGLAMPPAMAAALQPFPDRAGAASSFAGFAQQTAGALTGAAVGHALGNSAWPLVLGIAVMGFLTLAFWLMTDARHEGKHP